MIINIIFTRSIWTRSDVMCSLYAKTCKVSGIWIPKLRLPKYTTSESDEIQRLNLRAFVSKPYLATKGRINLSA